MAIATSATNPPVLGEVVGQHFTNTYPQVTAGASGNTLTIGASRVISCRVSGNLAGDFTWSFSAPTLTLTGLTNGDKYDIVVEYI